MRFAGVLRTTAAVVVVLSAIPAWCISTDALLANQIGDSFFASSDFEAAARQYREAVRLAPDYPAARYNLATVLDLKLGRGPEALEHYRAYLSLAPAPLQVVTIRISAIQEGIDYASLVGHTTIEAAETYLANYPLGTHAAEVRVLLSRLIDSRRKEEEVAREQQRRELEALGQPDQVERWAWLWKSWEVRWFRHAGTALVFTNGTLKRKVPFTPLDRQDDERVASIRKGILDGIAAERTPVVVVTPAKMTTSGLLDHLYIAARERLREEGATVAYSPAFDRALKQLLDSTSAVEPSEFSYTKKNDISGEETKVAMAGYRARCDIGALEAVPLATIIIPENSKITRIKMGDEVVNVIPGQSISLPADRYRMEVWAGSEMQRMDITLEPQQTVTLSQ